MHTSVMIAKDLLGNASHLQREESNRRHLSFIMEKFYLF